MFRVKYILLVDDRTFFKAIKVSVIPQKGSEIKAGDSSFIVDSHEQDLDAYDDAHYEKELWCDIVRASLNEHAHPYEGHPDVIEDLQKRGWKERK